VNCLFARIGKVQQVDETGGEFMHGVSKAHKKKEVEKILDHEEKIN